MAIIPAWFDADKYFYNKLAAMGSGWDTLTLKDAFLNAGYTTDGQGLYQHFLDYGHSEGISPDSLFVNNDYLFSKAVSYYNKPQVTTQQVQSMLLAMNQSGLSPWDHYQQYWDEKDTAGNYTNNPSVAFNSNEYMKDKLAQLQASDPAGNWDMPKLEGVFKADGLTPLSHYLAYGQGEGIALKAATPGASYALSYSDDTVFGTVGNDYIFGKLGSLDDGDYVDGGTGFDTLEAYTGASFFNSAVQPNVTNVEKVIFRAQLVSGDDGSNLTPTATIDAGNISGMTYLKNDNSRAAMVVEDVRTNSNQMTIGLADSDPGVDMDFSVYFDPQHLKAADALLSGKLDLKLMDVKNASTNNGPLNEQPFDQFKFQYIKSDGGSELITLKFRAADVALYKGAGATYATLLTTFQHALDDLMVERPDLAGAFTITRGASFNASATVDGINYNSTGDIVLLTSVSGAVSADYQLYPLTGWTVSTGNVPSDGRIVWDASGTSTADCPLIQTTVHLDNVARVQWTDANADCKPDDSVYGSESGDLIIGSMAARGGVERFDVKVDRGSWLASMASTNNTLRLVTIEHADINGDGQVGKNIMAQANDNDFGQLYIGQSLEATSLEQFMWTNAPTLLATNGLIDVKQIDATAFQGNLNIGAAITAESFDKYLNDVDGTWSIANKFAPRGERGEFRYDLGQNGDNLNLTVDAGIAADRDFHLDVNAGTGADLINFAYTGQVTNVDQIYVPTPLSGHQILNMAAMRTVVLNGEAGNDTIWSWGNGSVTANGGVGSDAIYVGQRMDINDSTVADPLAVGDRNAVWVFNTFDAADRVIRFDAVDGAQPVNNNILSTLSSVAYTSAIAAEARDLYVTVNFKGFTASALVKDAAGVTIQAGTAGAGNVSTTDLNTAIIRAIEDSAVLSKLLVAKDGAGYSLMIESLVDGEMVLADLAIGFRARVNDTTWQNLTITTPGTPYATAFGVDAVSALAVDGTDIGTWGINWVNGGEGNDVITLNASLNKGVLINTIDAGHVTPIQNLHDATVHDVLVINSNIGNDSIVNFVTTIDKINVDAMVHANASALATSLTAAGALDAAFVNATAVHAAAPAGGTGNVFNVADFLANYNTANANMQAVVLLNNGSNVYTAFQVQNDATAALTNQEVTVLGTMTQEQGAAFVTGDFGLHA